MNKLIILLLIVNCFLIYISLSLISVRLVIVRKKIEDISKNTVECSCGSNPDSNLTEDDFKRKAEDVKNCPLCK